MKRIVLAVLLAAAPAFAQSYGSDDGDGQRADDGYNYDYYGDHADERDRREREHRREEERRRREEEEARRRAEEQQWQGQDQQAQDDAYAQAPAEPAAPDFTSNADLTWNGRWIDTPRYGRVWQPTHVSSDWQPYREGRWAWTDAGWTWVSDEPFGWAVYHYGRWGFSPAVGWYWVPGNVWAPAWVEWRVGHRYAGWCALGPSDVAVVQPARWVWVETVHFVEPVRPHIVPLPRYSLPAPTTPRAGPPVRIVERATRRTVMPIAVRALLGSRGVPASVQPAARPVGVMPPPRVQQPVIAVPARTVQPAPRPYYGVPARPAQPAPAAPPAPSAKPAVRIDSPFAPHANAQPRSAPAVPRATSAVSRIAPPRARASW